MTHTKIICLCALFIAHNSIVGMGSSSSSSSSSSSYSLQPTLDNNIAQCDADAAYALALQKEYDAQEIQPHRSISPTYEMVQPPTTAAYLAMHKRVEKIDASINYFQKMNLLSPTSFAKFKEEVEELKELTNKKLTTTSSSSSSTIDHRSMDAQTITNFAQNTEEEDLALAISLSLQIQKNNIDDLEERKESDK